MLNRTDMYFTLEKGLIFNNYFISDELELSDVFQDLKLEINGTPLNKLYLKRRDKRISIYKNSAILLDNSVDSNNIKLSGKSDKEYLYLMIIINKLSTVNNIINLSIEENISKEELLTILSFKNEGLLIEKEVDEDIFIYFSSLLIRDYEENYENIINIKKRKLNANK